MKVVFVGETKMYNLHWTDLLSTDSHTTIEFENIVEGMTVMAPYTDVNTSLCTSYYCT